MAIEVKGLVYSIGETQQVSESFKKRSFIIEDDSNPKYPQFIGIEAKQDKCGLLDELRKGDSVTAHVNVEGRLWTNKEGVQVAFTTLSLWKLDINQTSAGEQRADPVNISTEEDESQDLPF